MDGWCACRAARSQSQPGVKKPPVSLPTQPAWPCDDDDDNDNDDSSSSNSRHKPSQTLTTTQTRRTNASTYLLLTAYLFFARHRHDTHSDETRNSLLSLLDSGLSSRERGARGHRSHRGHAQAWWCSVGAKGGCTKDGMLVHLPDQASPGWNNRLAGSTATPPIQAISKQNASQAPWLSSALRGGRSAGWWCVHKRQNVQSRLL
jgi:hypothetical protein